MLGLARPGLCSASDQRGVTRPQGGACDSGACDSGAFEGETPPVTTAAPSIGGTPAAGQTLTCDPRAFTQAPALAFHWLSDGAAIAGATGSTFTVTSAQLDTAVQCRVTANNGAGRALQCRVTATGPGASVDSESAPAVAARACIVPAVIGQTLAAARRRIARAGCAVGRTTKKQSRKKAGRVLASAPAAGANLAAGTKVALTIAAG